MRTLAVTPSRLGSRRVSIHRRGLPHVKPGAGASSRGFVLQSTVYMFQDGTGNQGSDTQWYGRDYQGCGSQVPCKQRLWWFRVNEGTSAESKRRLHGRGGMDGLPCACHGIRNLHSVRVDAALCGHAQRRRHSALPPDAVEQVVCLRAKDVIAQRRLARLRLMPGGPSTRQGSAPEKSNRWPLWTLAAAATDPCQGGQRLWTAGGFGSLFASVSRLALASQLARVLSYSTPELDTCR